MPKRIRIEALKSNDASWKKKREDFSDRDDETDALPPPLEENDPCLMNLEERQEWRQKIRDVIRMHPNIQEEVGPIEFPRNNGYYIASRKIRTSSISLMSFFFLYINFRKGVGLTHYPRAGRNLPSS